MQQLSSRATPPYVSVSTLTIKEAYPLARRREKLREAINALTPARFFSNVSNVSAHSIRIDTDFVLKYSVGIETVKTRVTVTNEEVLNDRQKLFSYSQSTLVAAIHNWDGQPPKELLLLKLNLDIVIVLDDLFLRRSVRSVQLRALNLAYDEATPEQRWAGGSNFFRQLEAAGGSRYARPPSISPQRRRVFSGGSGSAGPVRERKDARARPYDIDHGPASATQAAVEFLPSLDPEIRRFAGSDYQSVSSFVTGSATVVSGLLQVKTEDSDADSEAGSTKTIVARRSRTPCEHDYYGVDQSPSPDVEEQSQSGGEPPAGWREQSPCAGRSRST